MKDSVLFELAARWERDALSPNCEDGSPEAEIGNAIQRGHRECKRECADTIRMLVSALGESTKDHLI